MERNPKRSTTSGLAAATRKLVLHIVRIVLILSWDPRDTFPSTRIREYLLFLENGPSTHLLLTLPLLKDVMVSTNKYGTKLRLMSRGLDLASSYGCMGQHRE